MVSQHLLIRFSGTWRTPPCLVVGGWWAVWFPVRFLPDWWFPEVGVPPAIIHFRLGLSRSQKPSSELGVPPWLAEPPIWDPSHGPILSFYMTRCVAMTCLDPVFQTFPKGFRRGMNNSRSKVTRRQSLHPRCKGHGTSSGKLHRTSSFFKAPSTTRHSTMVIPAGSFHC